MIDKDFVKTHLRIDTDTQDGLIVQYIDVAYETIEIYLSKVIYESQEVVDALETAPEAGTFIIETPAIRLSAAQVCGYLLEHREILPEQISVVCDGMLAPYRNIGL